MNNKKKKQKNSKLLISDYSLVKLYEKSSKNKVLDFDCYFNYKV
jgi:hypothetical protein